ncbi:13194_t:CDS:2 [Gigaspora margarita]|uniref:13194_t:CDS:1 n=1 Tax=Gigaspora margarita TaxID=4874 RepID=A0ABN7WDQ0_GIGMA|nr:13194_t:CDS:2 [Gigaspora margarita]
MLRPNTKSSIASNKIYNKDGTFAKVINNIEKNMNTLKNWELFEITHNTLQDYALKAIEWHEKADKKLKSMFYTAQEQLQYKAKQMQTLDKMWNIKTRGKGKAPALSYREDILAQFLLYYEDILAQSKRQMQQIENCYNELKNQLHNLQNAKKELAKSQPYEVQRLISVFHYFRLLLNSEKKIRALEQITDNLWKDIRNMKYMSRCIRGWVKDFLEQSTLPSHQQEKHAKRTSLLDNENLKLAAHIWLCFISPKDRSPLVLKKELETNIFPKLLGVPITILEKTT